MPAHRPFTHWTADAEIAFIVALKLHGRPVDAAAEIGRSVSGAYLRRKRLPDFAAKWDAAIDDWRRRLSVGMAPPAPDADDLPITERFDGFTKQRRRAFLRKLTDTGDVEEACRYVRLSVYQAQHLRRCHPSFQAAWDRALSQSVSTLEQAAIERAVDGVEEVVWHAGRQVGTRRRYSDSLLKQMLATRAKADAAKPASPTEHPPRSTPEQTNAAILKKLDAMAAHEARRRDAESAALVARFRASWRAFGRASCARQEVLPSLANGAAEPGVRLA